ncbi:MAG: DNRLRE domain-containing protein, partial [Clostridia bacterium]|nr:DNRLRE domain-containing protein [Clostridia bacterium]
MKKLLALLLALALVVSYAAVFSASEVPADPTPVDSAPESPVETESLLTEDLKKQIVPEAEVPDLIDYSVAVAEKYVCRAYWEENDLNEVVFLKSDGTLARYYFAIPVKYEENGEIFDKKPALVERETLLNNLYRYELTAQNDTAFYCPDNLTHGFLYQGGGMEVALRPITQSEYDFLRGHANAGDLVLPGNILPEGYDSQAVTGVAQSALSVTDEETTAARYVLSTEGEQVNSVVAGQDILSAVPSYNGFQLQLDLAEGALTQTVYFELDSELLPIPTEGGLLLCDQKGNPVGILGDLLSESGVQNDIPWTVTESLSGTYLLSATLPRNGQTYTLSTTNLFDYLLDASIYSADQENYGQSANLWVGYHQSYSGIERVLIRPNNWYFTESAAPNQVVQSATLTIRDITVTSYEANIEARPFTGNVWTENEVCWNQASGNSYGPVLDSNPVSSAIGWNEGYYYSYDITFLVRNWYKGLSNWQKGLMICWDIDHLATSTMEKCFASSQYSNENYRPRLEATTAYTSPIADGVYAIHKGVHYLSNMNYTQAVAVQAFPDEAESRQGHLWRVKSIGGGFYTIRPLECTLRGLGYATELHVENIDVYDNFSVPENCLWRIIEVNGQYMLSPRSDLTRTLSNPGTPGSVLLSTLNTTDSSQQWTFTKHERIAYDEETPTYNEAIYVYDKHTGDKITGSNAIVSLFAAEKVYLSDLDYAFAVATEGPLTGIYPLWSSSQSSVTFGYDADGGYYIEALNPLVSETTDSTQIELEYSGQVGYLNCSLYVKVLLHDQTQYLKNLGLSDHFLNVENSESQTDSNVKVNGSFGDSPALWDFQFVGDGYYTVRAVGEPQNA